VHDSLKMEQSSCVASLNPLTPELNPSAQRFLPRFLLGILIFKGLTARRLYKSFGVKGLYSLCFQVKCREPDTFRCIENSPVRSTAGVCKTSNIFNANMGNVVDCVQRKVLPVLSANPCNQRISTLLSNTHNGAMPTKTKSV
jgi:hypothetical protein